MYPVPPFNQRVTNKRRIEQICKVRRERPEAVRHATDVFLRLVAITIDPKRGDHVQQTLRRIAGVRTLHTVSGPFDLIAVVAAESTAEIDNVLDHIGHGALDAGDAARRSSSQPSSTAATPSPPTCDNASPKSVRDPFEWQRYLVDPL